MITIKNTLEKINEMVNEKPTITISKSKFDKFDIFNKAVKALRKLGKEDEIKKMKFDILGGGGREKGIATQDENIYYFNKYINLIIK